MIRYNNKKAKIVRTLAYGLLAVCLLLAFSYADSQEGAVFGKRDTLLIFPGVIESNDFANRLRLVSQDVGEDALYQQFSKQNSAFLDAAETEQAVPIPETEVNTGIPDPAVEVEIVEDPVQSGENAEDENIEIESTETDQQETEVDSGGAEQIEEVPAEEEESMPLPDDSVSFERATEQIFTFISNVTSSLFPFAQQSDIIEFEGTPQAEPVEETQNTAENEIPTIDEAIPDPAEVQEQEPQPALNEDEEGTTTENIVEENGEGQAEVHVLSLQDFGFIELESGQFITNMQLRMSFAAKPSDTLSGAFPYVDVEYSFGDSWENAGSIIIDDEVSNALNGGYFLFALPVISDVEELQDLEIRVAYRGSETDVEGLYLDALWLEVDTEKFDPELLKARVSPEALTFLKQPEIHTLISSEVDFTRAELPKFSLRYDSQRNFAIRFFRDLFGQRLAEIESVTFFHKDIGDMKLTPKIDITDDGLFTLQLEPDDAALLQPGEYTVELVINEGGKVYTDTFSFQWGLLSINPSQTTYTLGDTAEVAMGALSPSGNTVCDADLALYVTDPESFMIRVPVEASGLCNGNNVVDVPDYSSTFALTKPGTYEIYLERQDSNGNVRSHTADTFIVEDPAPFTLKRDGPSRIYPAATYPMELTVKANEAWSGVLTERVPRDFTLSETDGHLSQTSDYQELSWEVSLAAGESASFSYVFDAPDISPFLYTLGPARLIGEVIVSSPEEEPAPLPTATSSEQGTDTVELGEPETEPETIVEPVPEIIVPIAPAEVESASPEETTGENVGVVPEERSNEDLSIPSPEDPVAVSSISEVIFEEHREWQIASDATGSMIVYWTNGASVPAGWTCLSCGSGTFYQRFAMGGSTYNTTGGATTHTHTALGVVNPDPSTNATTDVGTAISGPDHGHTYTPVISSATNLPAYRQLRVIQYNSAGEPPSIPSGAILMFDATIPAGWTQYSALDNSYARGENTITTAGSNTHTHTVTGTTGAASGGTIYNSQNGQTQVTASAASHTHSVSGSTASTNHEPPYITVIFATYSSATATPTGSLAMWSDTPPAGWANRSALPTDPFYGRFLKGDTTYGTTGGASAHAPANVTGITSGTGATDNARQGTATGGSPGTHTHSVDAIDFSSNDHLPPYITAIIGKRIGLIPLYDQTKYLWFVNTNAITPTDVWPVGGENLAESAPITASTIPVKSGDVVRLRMQLGVSNATSTADTFKLQYASTTAACSAAGTWTDVGSATSSTVWRGYNNASVSDGATVSSSTLTGTTDFETYEEGNPTATTPNAISVGEFGEWDFVLQQNGASENTDYCFRMVQSNGTPFLTYTVYPMLHTNAAPVLSDLNTLFDNEKVASTTPWFTFAGVDAEANDITYHVQISSSYSFNSPVIDRNSISHGTEFDNIVTPSDKDPFTNGETMIFKPTTALTNGTTYYWRVRGQDPNGSGQWGTWGEVRSFTIDTSVTSSTWFQTEEEQFETNTLTGVEATGSDLVQLISGSTTGSMISAPIAFIDGTSGTAWDQLAWNDTETSGDIKYQVQYFDGSTWALIPNGDLTGNSAGFDTSPVSLFDLDTTTYDTIRILANFTNSGGSPTLQDITVSWGYRVSTPTITAPFSSEKVSTTTPIFEFSATDPQNDALVYEIEWSTDQAFGSSVIRSSDANAGFTNLTVGADTSPFNSGNTIQFKVQAADALTNSTTYWWRVRARDPLGDDSFSFYAGPRSLTVDTSVTVSTWFQTTEEQFDSNIHSGTYALSSDEVTVATTTANSLIVYAKSNLTAPRYKEWNGSAWGSESAALDVGAAINWVVTRAGTTRSEYITATMGSDADVNVQVYGDGAWGDLQEVTASIADTNMRGFDVAYEALSGDALIVACDGDSNPSYYIWNGSSWSGPSAVGITSGGTCGWVRLASDPVSDEIVVVTRDTTGANYEARVWNGSSWGNSVTWGSMNEADHEGMAIAYEESGNQVVVAVSNGTAANFSWRAWNGSSWTTAATQVLGNDFEWGSMASDVGSDNMALCYVDEDSDVGAIRWTGSAWTGQTELDTAGNAKTDRVVDCAYEVGTNDGDLMVVYSDVSNVRYRSWNGASWSGEATVSTIQDSSTVALRRTGGNLLQLMAYDDINDRYDYSGWNGSSWSTDETIEANASVGASPFNEPFMIAVANPNTTGRHIAAPGIDFYEGSGPFWQQLSWSDSEPGGSSVTYQIEYYNGTSWQLVSDTLISGNSTGIGTSPIDLTGVLPMITYNMIRPVATLTCSGGSCPSLSDWTVTWAEGITVSGTLQAYDRSTNITSGTVAVALNGVLQAGKTGTVSGGNWSIANVNAAPGDIVTVFITGAADSAEAVGVTRYDGVGSITGMNLYERHLTVGSDDAATITNTNLGLYDFTNTEDIFLDVNGGNDLSLCATTGCGDATLYIKAGNTYQPGNSADATLHDFVNYGTFMPNGNTVRVSGSWDDNATSTMATSTVIFTATSATETIDQTGASTPSFNNVTFGETSGTATWNLSTDLGVTGNLSVTYGTLGRNTRSITVAGNLLTGASGFWTGTATTTFDGSGTSNWGDQNAAKQNVGYAVIDGSSKTILLNAAVLAESVTIGADDILDVSSSNYQITVNRGWVNNNTFVPRSGTVVFAATSANHIISTNGSAFYNLSFSGTGGSWSFSAANLSINNNFAITAGTVTMPTGTTTLAGSFTNSGGTFAHNNALIYFTGSSAKTITLGGTAFTNAFYNVRFTGSGTFTFTETNATTSNNFTITQGTVTFPSNTLAIGGSFINSAGTFAHNSGTVKFTGSGTHTVDTNASFNSLAFAGSGSYSFIDVNVTALGGVRVSGGTLTLPSGTFTIGGSLTNTATLTHNSGTVLMNSADTGETISLGGSPLNILTLNSASGGWTISSHATTTGALTLTAASAFTLASGQTLAVGGVFTNSVGGAATTWTGSTLSLESGNYSLNTKMNTGDQYATLRVKTGTQVKMWNSSASAYNVESSASLYSQDHNAVDGDLYIFGNYTRTSGSEHWSYATDFDGTALGGGSRQVDVRMGSGATAAFTGSTLNVVGTSVATTTIQNQGSGTYTLSVTGSTLNMSHYDFDHLGSTGLSLLGSNTVTTLSDGAFTPLVAAGTALTISSTTIDNNPGLQIFRVDFSTTTAIAAYNVTQNVGAASSYWWFRDTTGNIDGEANDNDSGDPGSIRWDDSSLVITVSGTVYSDEGTTPLGGPTCDGSTQNVRIVVDGGTSYTGSCSNVNGTYSIGGVVVIGDPVLTVYLNTNGGAQGAVVTKTPTANIANLDIYANRVIVRHEDVSAITTSDLAVYDGTDDSDIRFTAATGTIHILTLNAGTELHVFASKTFTPQGPVILHANASGNGYDGSLHVGSGGTLVGYATSTLTIGGSLIFESGASYTPASTTVIMTATTTGKGITTAGTLNLHELMFTGAGGGWNLSGNISATGDIEVAAGTLTGTGNVTLLNGAFFGDGSVSLGTGTTTIARTNTLGGANPWTFANLVLGNGTNVGTTTPGGTATTTILGRLTISTAHFLDANSSNWDLAGSGTVFVEQGTFLEDTSRVRYSGTTGSNILSTRYYDLDINASGGTPTFTGTGSGIQVTNDLTVGGAAPTTVTFNTSDPALDINGDLIIRSNGTFIASNSALTTIAGNYDNDGTFMGSGGTITFDGSGASSIAAGASSFSSLTINGTGSFTITEPATTSAAFTLTAATSFTLASGETLAVQGTFTNSIGAAATTWTGSTLRLVSSTNYQANAKTINDTYENLVIGANTDVRMWNSSATSYSVNSSGSLYSQDHASADGSLYVFGDYPGNGGTDYWSYATDFDGTALGGGSRAADVRFASGASATLTSGGLQVLGNSSASTTIQNQGSGTYGISIGGTASTTWSYYDIENINTNGLSFSGTPNVVTLAHGSFEVGVGGGSAITVAGSVITANPAKTFTGNSFATSTGISGFNVTATGATISSWRFTNHTGTIDGEAYDVDPGGDPGYVVWDDSSAQITIAGNVYSDEGSTVSGACDGTTQNVRLRVAGLTTYNTSCNASTGAYSFTGVSYGPFDSIVVYINDEAEKAASVSADLVTSISNFDLYENRVIVRHENTNPLAIDDMAVWDSSDDADIPFTALSGSPDTLTLPANRKLIVWTGKEFEPGGNVTLSGGGAGADYDGTLLLQDNAIFDANGTEIHTIGGSLTTGTGAIIDDATSTFIFTTTGAARTIDTNEESFYNLTFNGSGSWTVSNTALMVGNDLTISQGAVTLPAATTTIVGSLQNTGGSFNANGGLMLFTGSGSKTMRAGSSSFAELRVQASGTYTMQGTHATTTEDVRIVSGTLVSVTGTLSVGGNFINAGTFTHSSGVLKMTSATTTAVTLGASDGYALTIAGSGAFTLTNQNVALLGTLRIQNGSLTLATGTLSIGGSFLNTGGSFAHASGTILFNSSDTGETINPGSSLFNTVSIAAPTGGYTITNHATTSGNFSLTSAASFVLSSGQSLTVGGVFTNLVGGTPTTWTGSILRLTSQSVYTINTKLVGGDRYQTLEIGANTDIRSWHSAATTTTVHASASLYSQDHANIDGYLYVYGDYTRSTGTDYWSYATDFDGASIVGTPRAANIFIAANATTTLSGGGLQIIGSAGATTTIQNQGSGTYNFDVIGGTLNASRYALRNLNSSGLTLRGTPTITSLSYGDLELAVNGGALIDISSTTLNHNASLVISNTRFATTTAITGYNVALTGSTPSAWTFTSHSGNLSGEAFDDDGVTDCGSIRWQNSLCLLTEQTDYRWRNDDGGEGVPDSEWYDLDWDKRARARVTNSDATPYTNAAVKVVVPYDSDMQSDFDDLRFTDSTGTTTIPYFIESYTASTEAIVWVRVANLAALANTELYMYYGNGAVSDASSGASTFVAFDNFEDANISEYSGDTGLFAVSSGVAYERTYGLIASAGNDDARATDGMFRFDETVTRGETIRFMQYINEEDGPNDEVCTLFGVQSPGTTNQNYALCLEQVSGTDRMSLSRDVDDIDTSGTVLATTTVEYETGWYEVEVDWRTDNVLAARLLKDDVLIATTSATDSTYSSGGLGFTFWFQHGGWDVYSSRPYIATDPIVALGVEQVPGGASWYAGRNSAAVGLALEEVTRVRFLIENSGLTVTDQNYQIEFAGKGAAPSCEAVDYGDYVPVPIVASCGTSAVCMTESSQFTSRSATTDLLGGDGIFTQGQIVEDPHNNTSDLTIEGGEFTEFEYAIIPTINATDSAYCLRITDNGSELDSYARIAEFGLQFDPVVSTINLNNGEPIILSPGATTTVYATGTVTDLNGVGNIVSATSTIYRSGAGALCSADPNSCYISGGAPQCNLTNCSGNTCEVWCSADFYYHADPTDSGDFEGQEWLAYIEARDQQGGIDIGSSSGVELLTLRAITVDSSINYGALPATGNTGSYNPTTTVENIGNESIDLSLEGTDLTDGLSSVIPVSEQRYATTTFTYNACVICNALSTVSSNFKVDLVKPISSSPIISDAIYWGIEIPFGTAGNPHQGTTLFTPIGEIP